MERVMTVREAMTEKVLICSQKWTVAKAAKLMSSRGVGCIVVTQGRKPVGILTERDILKMVGADMKPDKTIIQKAMSKRPVTIGPDVEITEAARLITKNRIRRLPVVERDSLVGIITSSDIATISPRLVEAIERPEVPVHEGIETSVCEVCGEMTTTLHDINGMWLCENCRDAMGG